MDSCSGNSSGSGSWNTDKLIQNNSGRDQEVVLVPITDQRKRKRMQSNRESARRSRMRKQKHLDELVTQVSQLTKDNNQILTSINITTQHYMNIETQNSILRAQLLELTQRLESLNEILYFINSTTTTTTISNNNGILDTTTHHHDDFMNNNNIINTMYLNQPIMASPDMFQYY